MPIGIETIMLKHPENLGSYHNLPAGQVAHLSIFERLMTNKGSGRCSYGWVGDLSQDSAL